MMNKKPFKPIKKENYDDWLQQEQNLIGSNLPVKQFKLKTDQPKEPVQKAEQQVKQIKNSNIQDIENEIMGFSNKKEINMFKNKQSKPVQMKIKFNKPDDSFKMDKSNIQEKPAPNVYAKLNLNTKTQDQQKQEPVIVRPPSAQYNKPFMRAGNKIVTGNLINPDVEQSMEIKNQQIEQDKQQFKQERELFKNKIQQNLEYLDNDVKDSQYINLNQKKQLQLLQQQQKQEEKKLFQQQQQQQKLLVQFQEKQDIMESIDKQVNAKKQQEINIFQRKSQVAQTNAIKIKKDDFKVDLPISIQEPQNQQQGRLFNFAEKKLQQQQQQKQIDSDYSEDYEQFDDNEATNRSKQTQQQANNYTKNNNLNNNQNNNYIQNKTNNYNQNKTNNYNSNESNNYDSNNNYNNNVEIEQEQEDDKPYQKNEEILEYQQEMSQDQEFVERRQILLDVKRDVQIDVSDEKIQNQKERTKQLKQILTFEIESYPQILNIQPVTKYQNYINRISSKQIENRGNQAPDDLNSTGTQTQEDTNEKFQQDVFNQFPDDKFTNFQKKRNQTLETLNPQRLAQFILNKCQIIESILEKTDGNSQNQQNIDDSQNVFEIEKLNFKHQFIQTFNDNIYICNIFNDHSAIHIYKNGEQNQILFSQNLISTIQIIDSYIVGGTHDGNLVLWDLKNKRHNKKSLYENDYDQCFSTNLYQIGNELSQQQLHKSMIIKIKQGLSGDIYSLEEFGKIIQWNIIDLSQIQQKSTYLEQGLKTKVKLVASNQFENQDSGSDFAIDSNNIYICQQNQILKINKLDFNKQHYNYDYKRSSCIYVSNQNENFLSGYSDGSIAIFNKNYNYPLLSISDVSISPIIFIQSFQIQIKMKDQKNLVKIDDFTRIQVTNKNGKIYIFDFNENTNNPIHTIENNKTTVKTDGFNNQLQIKIASIKNEQVTEQLFNLQKYSQKEFKIVKLQNQQFFEDLKQLPQNY